MTDSDELHTALNDTASNEARKALCNRLGSAFSDVGHLLYALGNIIGSDRKSGISLFQHEGATAGLGLAGQIAGELISAATELVESNQYYAAMALVRQLVEVEYLAWAFSSGSSDVETWLRSSRQERSDMWQPRHLLSRPDSQFRGQDYHMHCERGGHPTPDARFLLPDHSVRLSANAILVEIAVHGVSCWDYFAKAVIELDHAKWYANKVPQRESIKQFHDARARWAEVERFPELARQRHWKAE